MALLSNPFTASKTQVASYLLGVALFSISFLVFLNATVSFVVTDLLGQHEGVGDAVGTLGFTDELVVIVMCPVWGSLSDILGVRAVAVVGYAIVGISLFVFVQARNVYPQLLFARIFFSVGAAATSTMVTAILPTMTAASRRTASPIAAHEGQNHRHQQASSTPSLSPSPNSNAQAGPPHLRPTRSQTGSSTSQIAGLVGMFTGIGALLALGVFLPLPARLSKAGYDRAEAVIVSFYIVGAVALVVGTICFFGLKNLAGEESKGWRNLFNHSVTHQIVSLSPQQLEKSTSSAFSRFFEALKLGFTDISIGLGYLGGFVARASSVAITLFIPLYVNAYFIRTGLCPAEPGGINDPSDVKEHCRRAYTLAAALSGVSQVVALLSAPIFGWADGRFHDFYNAPLLVAASAGVLGYAFLAGVERPEADLETKKGGVLIWFCMILLGLSQIGAIVCSLSLLGRGIDGGAEDPPTEPHFYDSLGSDSQADQRGASSVTFTDDADVLQERSALLQTHLQGPSPRSSSSRNHLKGTIAGLYSLSGGAGILLLTKLGGYLFDKSSPGAPFYMLSMFNAVLLVLGLSCSVVSARKRNQFNI